MALAAASRVVPYSLLPDGVNTAYQLEQLLQKPPRRQFRTMIHLPSMWLLLTLHLRPGQKTDTIGDKCSSLSHTQARKRSVMCRSITAF